MAGELTKAVNKGILDLLDPRNQGINQDMAGFARSQAPMQQMPMASRPRPMPAQGAVTSPLGNNPSLNPSEAMMQPVSRPQQPSGDPEYGRYLQSLVSKQQPQRGVLRDSEGRPVTSSSGEAVRTDDSDLPMIQQRIGQRAQQLMQEVPEEKRNTPEVQNGAFALSTAENAQVAANAKDQEGIQNTLKKAFGNEEMWLTLAMGFNSMRMRPDAGLAGVIGNRLKTIQANKGANQTIAALRAKGVDEATLTALQKSPELLKAVATKVFTKGFADTSAEQRFFEELTKDLSPEEKQEAIDIKLGRRPRAGSQYAQTLEQMLIWEKTKALGKASGKSEAEQKELAAKNARAFDVYQSGIAGLEQDLLGTSTGYFQGMLPAITSSQQKADMAINRMAPLLKNIFRESGEGVFTDRDQELLIGMIPTRGTNPEVIASSIKAINDIVRLKLGASAEKKAAPVSEQPMQTTPSAADVKKQAIEEARKRGLIK
jgi:hypothetical protein